MFYEPTTLASISALLADTLQNKYAIDPKPLFDRAGISMPSPTAPQLRIPLTKTRLLWDIVREATGDETVGLEAGRFAKPAHFYAFGYSWQASSTLLGAMQRLSRYYKLMSTASVEVRVTEQDDAFVLSALFPDESLAPPKEGIDCGMVALLTLCDIVAEKEIRPLRVELTCPDTVHPDAYRTALRAPITFNAEAGRFYFDKQLLREPLPHGTPEIAKATDRISEAYIDALDPHKVASQVRRLLVDLLPSGKADQQRVAQRLNRSTSTLHRQLQAEGVSYRDVLESTRRSLAENYLLERRHSQAQIAYLLGFSDQSNFARAFKRWTSMSPKQYQDTAAGS